MDWIGDSKTKYKGIQKKVTECFPNYSSFDVIVFQADSLAEVRDIKKEIRDFYKIGFSSVHITDTKDEAINISNLLFNKNGFHFLKNSDIHKHKIFTEKINTFNKFIKINHIDKSNIALDSSMTLEAYGIRKSSDIDYFIKSDVNVTIPFNGVENHLDQLCFHDEKIEDLLFDPKFYFIYDGIKFISFDQIYLMKSKRNEKKDIIDCKMMSSMVSNNKIDYLFSVIRQKIIYQKIKFNRFFLESSILILKKIKLYHLVKFMHDKIKK